MPIGGVDTVGAGVGHFEVAIEGPRAVDVQGGDINVIAGDERAVIVGELTARISASGKTIESAFALILTVSNGAITRFQMLDDSFAVSRAARS